MKKRILMAFITLFIIAIIVFACVIVNALFGNPISKALATRAAKEYLKENYSDTDYTLQGVHYSLKDGTYFAHAASKSNIDGDFTVKISMLGKPLYDDYSFRVEEHANVANRLFFEYREIVASVLESDEYPYTLSIGFGDLEFDREIGKDTSPDALTRGELINNYPYDVCALGATNGVLVLYVDTNNVTHEEAAKILLKTKEMLDEAGISFYSVDLVLQYPPYNPEESYVRPEGTVELLNFLYTDTYEDGLIERIEKCAEDTKNIIASRMQRADCSPFLFFLIDYSNYLCYTNVIYTTFFDKR